jgi:copper oxidase (laccase) domain-containing protein
LKPIFTSRTNFPLQIFFAGQQPKRGIDDWPKAVEDIARITGEYRQNAMFTVLASTEKDPGFGTLRTLVPQSTVFGDGADYNGAGPAAFMFQTADCPFLVIQNDVTGKVAMGHCGKYAMKPCKPGKQCGNMVTTILSHFKEVERVHLSAYITPGICGRCYVHDEDPALVADFYNTIDFGEDRSIGELDLVRRIKHELRHEGIPEVNIELDGRCTKENPGLSSYRCGDQHSNAIVVLVN